MLNHNSFCVHFVLCFADWTIILFDIVFCLSIFLSKIALLPFFHAFKNFRLFFCCALISILIFFSVCWQNLQMRYACNQQIRTRPMLLFFLLDFTLFIIIFSQYFFPFCILHPCLWTEYMQEKKLLLQSSMFSYTRAHTQTHSHTEKSMGEL